MEADKRMRERLSAYPFCIRCVQIDALVYELYGLTEEEIGVEATDGNG